MKLKSFVEDLLSFITEKNKLIGFKYSQRSKHLHLI